MTIPEGRLRDLLSTADRQSASRSYDAEIDTYRTALAELPGDAPAELRTELEGRLARACRARGASLGVAELLREAGDRHAAGRTIEALAAVDQVLEREPANAEAAQLREQLLPVQPAVPEPPAVVPVETEPPPQERDTRPIEPSMRRRILRKEYADEPPLSILDPRPFRERSDDGRVALRRGFLIRRLNAGALFAVVAFLVLAIVSVILRACS